jgi:inorganic pyrophosphatase
LYGHLKTHKDVSDWRLNMISHFFEHYKDLDKGKWVKINGWGDIDQAKKEILDGVANYNNAKVKPAF